MKEHYLHAVRTLLDCPPSEKERLLRRLNSAVATYFDDVPDAGEPDLVAVFGTPEDCAARLLDECTPRSIATERKKRSHRHRILIAVMAVLLTIMIGISVYLWSNGGLVIIRIGNAVPDYVDDLPRNEVTYSYDD